MIIIVTSVITYWSARSLGLSLEASDLDKLNALRSLALTTWKRQYDELGPLAADVRQIVGALDLDPIAEREQIYQALEHLKRKLRIDWLEVFRQGRPVLFPGAQTVLPAAQAPQWPIFLASAGPLAGQAFIVRTVELVKDSSYLLLARRAEPPPIPLFCLWSESGLLVGDEKVFPPVDRRRYEAVTSTLQRMQRGRLYRIRTAPLADAGPFLLVGYEADAATLTRTGVNELLLQLAVPEVIALLILGFFLARRLFAPLVRLREGIERVAAGHWQEIPVSPSLTGKDEISIVATSFNRMVRELRAAQEHLISVQRELVQKEKMAVLGRFSAGVAHEINNPLGTILVSAGLALEALQQGASVDQEELESIIEESKRCRQIVDTLLNYAQNRPPTRQATDLPGFLQNFLEKWAQVAADRGIVLHIEAGPTVAVLIDPLSISQVLTNLLENAVDALAGRESPRITVRVLPLDEHWVRVTISDNGAGPAIDPGQLFEPFRTTKAKGTGLGLAICQSIIESHGGRIWLERDELQTSLHFTLPTAAQDLQPDDS